MYAFTSADANCTGCRFSTTAAQPHYVNVVVAGKHALPQWLTMDEAGRALHGRNRHLAVGQQRPGRQAGRGDGLLRRHAHAGGSGGRFILRKHLPALKIRVINVVDLMKLQPQAEHPHG